ncbi:MAG TPA: M28 family peptidase [Flavobacteriales bacterium]|nr:M28 family peptidase [Flavobacteriales bacterium]
MKRQFQAQRQFRNAGGKWRQQFGLPLICTFLLFLGSCTTDPPEQTDPTTPVPALPELPATPLFDPDSSYSFVQAQVDFGPRIPGTASHKACGDWMVSRLKGSGATVIEQTGNVLSFNGERLPLRNIIGSWNLDRQERILLFAHWDTRPFADRDTERKNEPIDGANDGGSGVGILLEIARHLAAKEHGPGVDILFTDVEDHGEPSGAMTIDENSMDTWCLGSRYWARNPHVPGYTARFGILLDMAGARDAKFYQEALSMQYAPGIVRKVWKTAAALGYGDRFIQETKYFVGIDDHIPVNQTLRIPSIDIIEYDPSTQAFGPYWHTHKDNMEVIDPATLKAVGQTVMEVVWKER